MTEATPIPFDFIPTMTPKVIEMTEGDLIASWSDGFRYHIFLLWVAVLIYAGINRYEKYLVSKHICDERFYEHWKKRAHDIAILISMYYPLIYILYFIIKIG